MALIDADSGQEWLIGDEIDIDDIVWFGSVKSVGELAAEAGVEHHAPMAHLAELVNEALKKGRKSTSCRLIALIRKSNYGFAEHSSI